MKRKIVVAISAFIIALSMSGCFGAPKPKSWIYAGFNEMETSEHYWKRWEEAGFSSIEASRWRYIDEDISLDKVLYYIEKGVTLNIAREWDKLGAYPNDVLEAKRINFLISEAKEWYKEGIAGKDAIVWKKSGFKVTIEEVVKLQKSGFDFRKYEIWSDKGLTIKDMLAWANIKIKFEKIVKLKKSGVNAEEYLAWDKAKVNTTAIIKFASNNITLEKYIKFRNVELNSIGKIIAWSKTGAKMSIVKKFKYLDSEIVSNVKKLKKVTKYCKKVENQGVYSSPALGLYFDAEKGHLSSKTPFTTKGKCFNYTGKVTAIRNKKEVEIEECVKTDNQFDRCMGGRVSILKFEKSIPSTMTKGSSYSGLVQSGGHIKKFLYGNSSKNTDIIYPVLED